jgi:hypothetical protein
MSKQFKNKDLLFNEDNNYVGQVTSDGRLELYTGGFSEIPDGLHRKSNQEACDILGLTPMWFCLIFLLEPDLP